MKTALVNYYARLIKRGIYKIEDVPEDGREEVLKVVDTLPEPEFDPVTQTPEDNGKEELDEKEE